MKYCTNCGKELADNAAFCTECGAAQAASAPQQEAPQTSYQQNQYQQNQAPYQQQAPYQPAAPVDSGSFGWAVLGFCIPLVGLVLYLVWKTNKPLSAKKAGIGALVGFCLNLIFSFIGGMMG
ncbi:MAG: zinc-ribbon domain-containing protein [Clostridia bacterium]